MSIFFPRHALNIPEFVHTTICTFAVGLVLVGFGLLFLISNGTKEMTSLHSKTLWRSVASVPSSPPPSPVNRNSFDEGDEVFSASFNCKCRGPDPLNLNIPSRICYPEDLFCSKMSSIPMSLDKAVSLSKLLLESGSQSRGESTLELEALAAVHQLSHAVQSISVSEMLPRTPELIFVNLTTAEGQPYCLELTHKGWRVTSLRSDCMQGDFTRMELFTKYYDSLYDLMEVLSPGYKQRFGEKVSQKLRMYENCDEYPACACSPPIRPDNSSSCSTTSDADSS